MHEDYHQSALKISLLVLTTDSSVLTKHINDVRCIPFSNIDYFLPGPPPEVSQFHSSLADHPLPIIANNVSLSNPPSRCLAR